MLDMGFRPAVDRIVSGDAARAPDAVLLGHARRRGGPHRRRATPATPAATSTAHAEPSSAPTSMHRFVAVQHEAKIDALVERAPCPRPRPRARLRAHQARRRPPGQAPARPTTCTAVAMHGDKSQSQREKALARFERGDVDTLVATDVAARGLDVEGITHVINFDAPGDHEGYVHRIGRTARAGATGVGITFVLREQAATSAGSRARSSSTTSSTSPASRTARMATARARTGAATARAVAAAAAVRRVPGLRTR